MKKSFRRMVREHYLQLIFCSLLLIIFLTIISIIDYVDRVNEYNRIFEELKKLQTTTVTETVETTTESTTVVTTASTTVTTTMATTEAAIQEDVKDVIQSSSWTGTFRVTAYCGCPSCSEGYGNLTSTGVSAIEGRTIAVDPSVIPYGSRVWINGNIYIAEDCGGAIKGNRIDIYMSDHARAQNFGVQYLDVAVEEV